MPRYVTIAPLLATIIVAACAPCFGQEVPARGRTAQSSIDAAVAKLHNGEQAVREEGARELVAAGRAAIAALRKTLGEDESRVRDAAAEALARIGEPALKTLTSGLEDDNRNSRRGCARALIIMVRGSSAGPDATQAADELLRTVRRGSTLARQRAINLVGHICADPATCPPTVLARGRDALVGALDDSDPDVRWHAVRYLGRMSADLPAERLALVTQTLQGLLASSVPQLRGATAWALHREDAAAASMDLDADATVTCLALAFTDGSLEATPAIAQQVQKRGPAIADAILAMLAADVAWEQATASLQALRMIGRPAHDALVQHLSIPDAALRAVAASALSGATRGRDDAAVSALQKAVGDADGAVRLAAATSLGAGAGALEPLVSLLGDEYDYVREGATEALVAASTGAVASLVGALSSGDVRVRRLAVTCIGRIGDMRAVRPLIGLLSDADPPIRAAVAPLIEALQDSATGVRVEAAGALAAIGDPQAIAPLIAALRDADAFVRATAVAALGVLGSSASDQAASHAMEALLMAMRPESGICSPAQAAEALGRMGPAAVRPLMLLLRDNDPRVRQAAINGLGVGGSMGAAGALVGLLGDPEPAICAAAAAGLLAFRTTEAATAGAEALAVGLRDPADLVRARSAALLGQLLAVGTAPRQRADAAQGLRAALGDAAGAVRAAAARALGDLRDAEAVGGLIAALGDVDHDVRRAAAAALQRIRTPAALEALREAGRPATQ